MYRVPQDINPNPSAKSAPVSSEPQKVDKPLSPQAEKTKAESLKPPSPEGSQGSSGAGGAPYPLTCATLGHNPAGTPSGPEPAKSPEPPVLWTRGYRWLSTWRRFIYALVQKADMTVFTGS
jgi:hypothetical protein